MIEGIDIHRLQPFNLEGFLVSVVDGDTIELRRGNKRIAVRLAGIDTPETAKTNVTGQPGAQSALVHLQQLVSQNRSKLQLWIVPGQSTHNRMVGVLVIGKMNVNLEMVRRGLASTYYPSEGLEGVNFRKMQAAERRSFKNRVGLFRDPEFRSAYLMNKTGSAITNAALADSERLANSYSTRVRARMLAGLRSSDHSMNVPNAIMGMKPNRPDFPGGRAPYNLESMGLVSDRTMDYLKKSSLGWQRLFGDMAGRTSLTFLDIETTGLRAADYILNLGYLDPMRLTGAEYAIQPGTWKGRGWEAAQFAIHEARSGDVAIKNMRRGGTTWSRFTPGGDLITQDMALGELMENEAMPLAMRKNVAAHVRKLGGTSLMPNVMKEMLGAATQQQHAWMFIHNTNFESPRVAPGITDALWRRLRRTGKLAFASDRKDIANAWSQELFDMSFNASQLEYSGNIAGASRIRTKWYSTLRDMMRGKIATPAGLKTVDVMDVARGVFGTAAVGGYFKGPTTGLLGQEALAAAFNLPKELHTALDDASMSSVIAQKLMSVGDRIMEGRATAADRAFLSRAQQMQPMMAAFNLYKDIINKTAELPEGAAAGDMMIAVRQHQNVKSFELSGVSGGEAATRTIRFRPVSYQRVTLDEYVQRQMGRAGISGKSADIIARARGFSHIIKGDLSDRAFMDQMIKDGDKIKALTASGGSVMALESILEAASGSVGKSKTLSMTSAVDQAISKTASIPTRLSEAWTKLPTGTKSNIKVAAAVAGGVALLGVVRGLFEPEFQPDVVSFDPEAYRARRQMNEYLQNNNPMSDRYLSETMVRLEKDPGRYYPAWG